MSEQESPPADDGPGGSIEEAPDERTADQVADAGETPVETVQTDALADVLDEHEEALADSLETIATMQETGTLDDLAAFAGTVSLLQAAMDDEMVMTLAETGSRLGEVADTAADEDVARGLEHSLDALGEATSGDPDPVGMLGLVRAMRDPEVKAGMGVAITLLRALGRDAAADQQEA